MAISKTQPMRQAEIDLIDSYNQNIALIPDIQEDISDIESDIDTLQSDLSTATGNITTLQNYISDLMTVETIDYKSNILPASNVTISSATMKKLGRIAMLHVEFSYSGTIASNSQQNMFDISGSYKPIAGCPASVNGTGAAALINSSLALWIKTFPNATFTGSHYSDCIYITNS